MLEKIEKYKPAENYNKSVYGSEIADLVKKHDLALEQGRVYHLSVHNNISILNPSIPAEEIVDGKIVWDDDLDFSKNSEAVCFGNDISKNLEHNPIKKGYIYAPKSTKGFRRFYAEAAQADEWLDSAIVGEVRSSKSVEVEKVGEFEMMPTKEGLKPEIKWY